MREAQDRYGREAVDTWVISMTHNASDLLAVAAPGKETGLIDVAEQVARLKVVPLFETIADLHGAAETMDEFGPSPRYATSSRCRATSPR